MRCLKRYDEQIHLVRIKGMVGGEQKSAEAKEKSPGWYDG